MQTPANVAKHPIHPMLVAIPIGLWFFSLICDLVFLASDNPQWALVARYTLAGGIVGALIAAIPGTIDMLSLPRDTKRIALVHMAINLTVVALYAINLGLRLRGFDIAAPIWLSVVAIGLLLISGWLGGKLIYVHGVAVQYPPEPVTHAERHRLGY